MAGVGRLMDMLVRFPVPDFGAQLIDTETACAA
jgi:hypothetical protein